jgi:hypothetical protein
VIVITKDDNVWERKMSMVMVAVSGFLMEIEESYFSTGVTDGRRKRNPRLKK